MRCVRNGYLQYEYLLHYLPSRLCKCHNTSQLYRHRLSISESAPRVTNPFYHGPAWDSCSKLIIPALLSHHRSFARADIASDPPSTRSPSLPVESVPANFFCNSGLETICNRLPSLLRTAGSKPHKQIATKLVRLSPGPTQSPSRIDLLFRDSPPSLSPAEVDLGGFSCAATPRYPRMFFLG